MLVSADKTLIDHARKLSTQARDPAPHYQHSEIGYNYRLSNLLAAVGRGQLQALAERVRRKREIFQFYADTLGDPSTGSGHRLPGIDFMPEAPWGRATRWLSVIIVDRAQFGAELKLRAHGYPARNRCRANCITLPVCLARSTTLQWALALPGCLKV
jgi:dTDP-4-amino-4,6-dideoxygalactose transaminase